MPERTVTKYDVTQWLETQIEARRLQNIPLVIKENDNGINDTLVNFSRTSDIHIGAESVRYVAKMLSLDLCVKARPRDEDNPYEIFVIYNGEVFFGIETEAEYKERGAVV